eukprot:1830939-Alexandrium_andersonii.AAC.1
MSASLVGSEMCIRDRSKAAPPAKKALATFFCQVPRALAAAEEREAYKAVSYTHLTLPTICSV